MVETIIERKLMDFAEQVFKQEIMYNTVNVFHRKLLICTYFFLKEAPLMLVPLTIILAFN